MIAPGPPFALNPRDVPHDRFRSMSAECGKDVPKETAHSFAQAWLEALKQFLPKQQSLVDDITIAAGMR